MLYTKLHVYIIGQELLDYDEWLPEPSSWTAIEASMRACVH